MIELPTSNIVAHMDTIATFASHPDVVNILELGTEYGTGSTQAIRCGLEQSIGREMHYGEPVRRRVWVSVDLKDQIHPWLRPRWPWWRMVVGDSRDQATVESVEAYTGRGSFQLIYIDTHHTPECVAAELKAWAPYADPLKCVWLFHDTWMNGVRNPMCDAIQEFAAVTGDWRFEDISKANNGLGALFPYHCARKYLV